MGVSGSGKSTLAAALAGAIHCPFLEGDEFHSPEAVRKMGAGTPLTDDDRWPWLERLGRAIATAAASDGVAVASCSALKRIYRDRLRQSIAVPVYFVLLEPSRETSRRRLAALGADDALALPFSPLQLQVKLRRMLGSGSVA